MDEKRKKNPLFSVIVLVPDNMAYLIPFTMDSIVSQSSDNFEIVVIDGQQGDSSLKIFDSYRPYISRIYSALDLNIYSMMNKGVALAKGQYLHFLMPGEFYLSCHAFTFLDEFIRKHDHPDLLYGGCIVRHSMSPNQIIFKQMTEEDLKGGRMPASLQSYWFRKEAFLKIGLFNPRFELQGGLDLICRFYLSKSLSKIFVRRILTDHEYRKPPPKKIIRQYLETLFIVFLYFGLSRALVWWIAQNHLHLLVWSLKNLKAAFWKKRIV